MRTRVHTGDKPRGCPPLLPWPALALLLLANACGASSALVQPSDSGQELWVEGPLHQWLPEGGDPVVLFDPQVLTTEGPMQDVVFALVGDDFLSRIRERTAVDLLSLRETALAFYDDETLLLARGPYSAEEIVTVVGMHMRVVVQQDSEPTRRSGTYDGRTLFHAAAIGPHEYALSRGEGAVLSRLLQRLHAGETPAPDRLAERDMQRALSPLPDGPLRIAVSAPLRLPLNSPLGLLLANQRAMAIAVTEADGERLRLQIAFVGEFPVGAETNFRQWIEAMARDDLGRVMGLNRALDSLAVVDDNDRIVVSITISSGDLVRGIRVLFDAEIADLVEGASATD